MAIQIKRHFWNARNWLVFKFTRPAPGVVAAIMAADNPGYFNLRESLHRGQDRTPQFIESWEIAHNGRN